MEIWSHTVKYDEMRLNLIGRCMQFENAGNIGFAEKKLGQ